MHGPASSAPLPAGVNFLPQGVKFLPGPTAPAPAATAPSPNLTKLATHIATNETYSPAFVKSLRDAAKADPTFQARLNAEVHRVSQNIRAQRDTSTAGLIGSAIDKTINPAQWAQTAVHGVNELQHGHLAAGALDVAAVLPVSRGPRAILEGLKAAKAADEGARVAKGVEAARASYKARQGLVGGAAAAVTRRTPAEAQQHLLEAAKSAQAEGHGVLGSGGVKNAPLLRPGEVTPETGGELGAQVRGALKGAAKQRTAQSDLYHEARAARAAAANTASEAAGGGLAGHAAAKAALAGELPKIHWNNELVDLNQQTLDQMVRFVQNHPSLRLYERTKTIDALQKLTNGGVPAAHEQKLLERAFGKETAGQLSQLAKSGGLRKLGVDVMNLPRAIMASADLSAPLRQGLVAGAAHPSLFAKNFGPMLRMAKSEDFYQASMDAIHADPLYPLMDKARLALTDLGKTAEKGAAQLGGREEARMSNLAEHMPGNNQVSKLYNRTFGTVIRGSDRAYVGFLNKMRADYFRRLVSQASADGLDVNDEKLLRSIGSVVNVATGRGNVPAALQDHLATMNALFFSPRLMASRINLLNPVYYMRLDPFARKEALRAFLSLGAYGSTVLGLATLAGAKVVTDPTNADFGKARFGNTRIDVLGGFQQYVRLAAQLEQNRITSSTTGKNIPLGAGFAKTSRYDVIVKFLQGKFSPIPSIIVDTAKGQDFTGKPVNWTQLSTYQRELGSHMIPFLAQDLHDLYTTSGPAGLLAGPLDVFGVGVQAYKAKPPSSRGTAGSSGGFGGGGASFGGDTGGFGSGSSGGFGG